MSSSEDQPGVVSNSDDVQHRVSYVPSGSTLVLAKPLVSTNNVDAQYNSNKIIGKSS